MNNIQNKARKITCAISAMFIKATEEWQLSEDDSLEHLIEPLEQPDSESEVREFMLAWAKAGSTILAMCGLADCESTDEFTIMMLRVIYEHDKEVCIKEALKNAKDGDV